MKFLYSKLITLFFSFISTISFSQDLQYCATQTSEENMQFINDNMDLIRYYESEYYSTDDYESDGEEWEESPHEKIGARDGTIYSSEMGYVRPKKKNYHSDKWPCSYCSKNFDTKKGATYHENIYCNFNPNKKRRTTRPKKINNSSCKYYECWSCSYCNKNFDTKKGATYHENIYCNLNPNKKRHTKKLW